MRLASWNALLAAPIMLVLLRISPNAWMPVMARENESEGLLVVALLWTGGIALFYAVVSFLFKSLSKFAGYHLDRQWTLSAKQKVLKVLVYSVPVAILALAYFGSYLRKYLTIDEVSDVWSNWTLLPALALVVLYIVTEVPITTRLEKVVGRTLHQVLSIHPLKAIVSSVIFILLLGLLRKDAGFAFHEALTSDIKILGFVGFNLFADGLSLAETRWLLRRAVKSALRGLLVLLVIDLLLSAAIFLLTH